MRLNGQDLDDQGYDHGESVVTRVLVAVKLGFISVGGGFDRRFLVKSVNIEEVSLTKPYTANATRVERCFNRLKQYRKQSHPL